MFMIIIRPQTCLKEKRNYGIINDENASIMIIVKKGKTLFMNTQQLESFLAVAEHLNFARAAETLNIKQSAVSRQIHAL